MRVMQVIADHVVDVVAVRHGHMPAGLAVLVIASVIAALMPGRAAIRMLLVDREHVLVDVVLMRMVQVTIVQVVHVIAVADGRMATARPVDVRMVPVNRMVARHASQSPGARARPQLIESKTRSHRERVGSTIRHLSGEPRRVRDPEEFP
jgi:hypothetical protein